jgi:hypothetical protein
LTEAQKKITQKFGHLNCSVTCASEKVPSLQSCRITIFLSLPPKLIFVLRWTWQVVYTWTDAARGPLSLRWIPENVKALKDLVIHTYTYPYILYIYIYIHIFTYIYIYIYIYMYIIHTHTHTVKKGKEHTSIGIYLVRHT